MRIASLIYEHQVNAMYRALIPLEALARRGHTVDVEQGADLSGDTSRFLNYHAVFIWRCASTQTHALVQRLQAAGIAVLWDNDEDFSLIPADHPEYREAHGLTAQRFAADVLRMIRVADVVTVPSAGMAEHFASVGGIEARVIESYLSPSFARPRRVPKPEVTVGWLATRAHRIDYERLGLREVFERLLRAHPQLTLRSIGLDLGLDDPRYRHVEERGYERLPRALSAFDVGIAPLADIPLNVVRSNVKLKEYAMMGLPWLASPVGPYATLGPDQGGELVPDDGWYAALERIVVDADHRHRLAANGKSWAQRQTIVNHVQEWEQVLRTAVKGVRAARAAASA